MLLYHYLKKGDAKFPFIYGNIIVGHRHPSDSFCFANLILSEDDDLSSIIKNHLLFIDDIIHDLSKGNADTNKNNISIWDLIIKITKRDAISKII